MFHDRRDAGQRLAAALKPLHLPSPVLFALPRGGVPVAAEIAMALDCPLSLLIVRKVGHPAQPELALGAIVDGDPPTVVRNDPLIEQSGIGEAEFQRLVDRERPELARRRGLYALGLPPLPGAYKTAVIVDDGLATGATARAAIGGLRARGWRRIVLAVPVAPVDTLEVFGALADRVVCPVEAHRFYGVGAFYEDFHQVSDQEVLDCLAARQGGAI